MKKYLLLFLFLISNLAFAQFEGFLELTIKKYSSNSHNTDENNFHLEKLQFYLGRKDFIVETGDTAFGGQKFIIQLSRKCILFLLPEQKQFMELPFSMFREISSGLKMFTDSIKAEAQDSIKKGKTKFLRTGDKKNIGGFPCTKYLVNEGDVFIEAWVALKFSDFFKSFAEVGYEILSGNSIAELDDAFYRELADKGGFPMQIIEKDRSGKKISESFISKIEEKKFDSSFFSPPKDYKKMDFNELMNKED